MNQAEKIIENVDMECLATAMAEMITGEHNKELEEELGAREMEQARAALMTAHAVVHDFSTAHWWNGWPGLVAVLEDGSVVFADFGDGISIVDELTSWASLAELKAYHMG